MWLKWLVEWSWTKSWTMLLYITTYNAFKESLFFFFLSSQNWTLLVYTASVLRNLHHTFSPCFTHEQMSVLLYSRREERKNPQIDRILREQWNLPDQWRMRWCDRFMKNMMKKREPPLTALMLEVWLLDAYFCLFINSWKNKRDLLIEYEGRLQNTQLFKKKRGKKKHFRYSATSLWIYEE